MSLSEYDRMLLDRCLKGGPRAWEDFVDRFLGLVLHVAQHTIELQGTKVDPGLREDFVAEVFLKLLENNFAVLRRFRRQCSLATYLTVVARRVILRRLLKERSLNLAGDSTDATRAPSSATEGDHETRFDNQEHVEKLLLRLDQRDAQIVRMYHLEGKSYREISSTMGIAENSVGPALTRARAQMRDAN